MKLKPILIIFLLLAFSACQGLIKVKQLKVNTENAGRLSIATFDVVYYYKNSLNSYSFDKNNSTAVQNTNFSAGFSQLKGKAKQRYIILAEQVPDWSQRTLKFQIINRVDLTFLTYAYTAFQKETIIQSASLLLDSSYSQTADIKQFQIAAITKSGKICGWTFNVDTKTVKYDYCVIAHAVKATCIISANDGFNFITGGQDKAIRIWASGKPVMSFVDNQKAISCLHVSNDQNYLISGNQGGTINIYDYSLYWLKASWTDHSAKVNSVTASNDSKIVASCGQDGFIVLRSISPSKLIQKIKVESIATQITFAISNYHPSELETVDPVEYLYSSHKDGSVIVWKVSVSGIRRVDQDENQDAKESRQ